MPTKSEWLACKDANGNPLPRAICDAYQESESRRRPPPVQTPEGIQYVSSTLSGYPLPTNTNVEGPGTDLKNLLDEYGFGSQWCESCEQFAARMNAWGVEGCRKNLDLIVERLRKAEEEATTLGKIGIQEKAYAAWKSITTLDWINPLDRHRSIALKAIERSEKRLAEAKQNKVGESEQ